MKNLLLKKGNWILIKENVPVEYPIPPFSLWYAVPTKMITFKGENEAYWSSLVSVEILKRDIKLRFPAGIDVLKTCIVKYITLGQIAEEFTEHQQTFIKLIADEWDVEQQVKIVTPGGDINIQPHEYIIINDINKYIDFVKSNDAELIYLTKAAQLSGKIKEQIFYLRTRGIGFTDALMMCVHQIKTQHLFYIKIREEYARLYCRYYDLFLEKEKKWIFNTVLNEK